VIAAHDAEAVRSYPLERVFIPLECNAILTELEATSPVAYGAIARGLSLHGREIRIAIEAVGICDTRPQRFR
jgi:hypothetical protein